MNHAIRIIVNLLSNLIYFCVVLYVILGYTGNRNQRWFRPVADVLDAVLDRIRGLFPTGSGIDFSPMILLLLVWFFQRIILSVF